MSVKIISTISFDAEPNNVYPDGHWTVDYEVYLNGHILGGGCHSATTLANARLGLEEEIRRSTDILPPQRYGARRVIKWIKDKFSL